MFEIRTKLVSNRFQIGLVSYFEYITGLVRFSVVFVPFVLNHVLFLHMKPVWRHIFLNKIGLEMVLNQFHLDFGHETKPNDRFGPKHSNRAFENRTRKISDFGALLYTVSVRELDVRFGKPDRFMSCYRMSGFRTSESQFTKRLKSGHKKSGFQTFGWLTLQRSIIGRL